MNPSSFYDPSNSPIFPNYPNLVLTHWFKVDPKSLICLGGTNRVGICGEWGWIGLRRGENFDKNIFLTLLTNLQQSLHAPTSS